MVKAAVYYMDDRSINIQTSLAAKAQQLFDHAQLHDCFKEGNRVGVKVHMGEWFCTGYLRPILVRAIVDKLKKVGAEPFVTDCTVMPYTPYSARTTAEDYLECAAANGFTRETMGCPILIADGPSGLDDVRVELPDGILLREAYLGKGIAEADALIVVSHFKGHGWGVYGGSIKNVGIGCSSKRGKFCAHLAGHPVYGPAKWPFHGENCKGRQLCPMWEMCSNMCPADAIRVLDDRMEWNPAKCIGCLAHTRSAYDCGVWDIPKGWVEHTNIAMADAAAAYVRYLGKEHVGFLTYAIDITPSCDCAHQSDRAIIPNLGVFASKDLVAIDRAILDMSMKSVGVPGSASEEKGAMDRGVEKFTAVCTRVGASQWLQTNVCERLGVGTKNYELIPAAASAEDEKFWFPRFSPRKTNTHYLRSIFQRTQPIPEGGFIFNRAPRVSVEELSRP